MHCITSINSLRTVCFIILIGLTTTFSLQALPLDTDKTESKTVIMVRDYTYNASENDSKVSARKAALEQLQKAAIEEVGVHVQSSVVNHETVTQNADAKGILKREMQLNFKTFSQALTKTKILDEKWNGETFYIKAEIEVNPNGITAAMNTVMSGNTLNVCETNAAKIKLLYKKAAGIERNQEIADIAISTKFDEECNKWQYGVLSVLTRYPDYPIKGYRKFIFQQLDVVKSYDVPRLLPDVLTYAIAHNKQVSKEEWNIILNSMQRMPTTKMYRIISILTKLELDEYQRKINDIIQLASDGKLGKPSVNKEQTIQTILKVSLGASKEFTAKLYLKYADELVDADKLAPIVRKIFEWAYTSQEGEIRTLDVVRLADDVVEHFFENTDVTSLKDNAKRDLYEIMRPLINASRLSDYNAKEDTDNQYIRDLLNRFPNQFAYIVESYPISEPAKNLFLLQNNLPAVNLCKPKKCVKQALNRELKTTKQNEYLDYLAAYGSKSHVAEKDIIKLLDRARAMPSNVHRTHRKTVLINILANIKTQNTKAINLIINNLNDFDYKVPDTAISALGSIGMPAFERIKVLFPESEDLVKRRMIEAIGLMKPSKELADFLKSIPTPSNLTMKFAIEDALEVIESGI
jgi:hypothetical protein